MINSIVRLPARSWVVASAIAIGAVAAGSCGTVEPVPVPPAPSMVPASGDPFVPVGIRPDPDAPDPELSTSGAIIVQWQTIDPARLVGVRIGGFNVYRSDSLDSDGRPVNFRRVRQLVYDAANPDTIYVDTEVRQNVKYSYVVTSYSRSDNSVESPNSDTASMMLIDRPVPESPIGNTLLPTDRPLRFSFGPTAAAGNVAIVVDEVDINDEKRIVREMWRKKGLADFNNPHLEYDGSEQFQAGKRYRWRVAKILPGAPAISNSSRWVTFTAQ